MRCQERGGGEDDPPLVPRLGTRTGSTLMFSTTTRFCDMKQKQNYSFLTSRSIAKTSYTIRSSGVLLQTGRVFLMTFIVRVKSYMEVSNETSDMFSYYIEGKCKTCHSRMRELKYKCVKIHDLFHRHYILQCYITLQSYCL